MITGTRFIWRLLASLLLPAALYAQPTPEISGGEEPVAEDSIASYRLGEIEVKAGPDRPVTTGTVNHVPFSTLNRSDQPTAATIAREIPAARVQTNSRGESLLYLRGAAERQVGIFLDGALLNVPWDNRIDLSLVPLQAVGGVTVSKGIASVLYGANVVGGAANFTTQELPDDGTLTHLDASIGQNSYGKFGMTHLGRIGSFSYTGAAGYSTRAGFALPAESGLEFNQQSDSLLRTNTDSKLLNLYLRGEKELWSGSSLGLSLNYIDGEKGVAPEGHKSRARFWRMPEWNNLSATINSDLRFGADDIWNLRGALWATRFNQTIDQFRAADYQTLSARQEDRDRTAGMRVIVARQLFDGSLSLALNALESTHDQRDQKFDSKGVLVPFQDATGIELPYPTLRYRQRILSAGVEYGGRLAPQLTTTLGVSFDAMQTPETGGKPEQEAISDYGLTTGLAWQAGETTVVHLSAGRKTRFPTMRELYGAALGRFIINPDLKAEESWLGELGVETGGALARGSIVGFVGFSANTIDQRTVDTLGTTQRINLPGSRSGGVELSGSLLALRPLRVDGHLTWIHARGIADGSGGMDSTFFLSERPELLGSLTLLYDAPFGLTTALEVTHTGRAYTLDGDNEFEDLPTSTVINARLGYRLFLPQVTASTALQVYLRINNITDEVVVPQLGLPGPGRELQAGVKVSL